jgi:hypothetical protein
MGNVVYLEGSFAGVDDCGRDGRACGATEPPTSHTYTVQGGDPLSSIAQRLGLNWFHDLYMPNQVVIEAAARAHGQLNSESGNLIYPGTALTYQK